jgi:transcriptional regulator GlxA family with amidase domain
MEWQTNEHAREARVVVARIEGVVPDGLEEALRVSDLARAAGVSARTLYRAFARHRGAPPITHLRRSRLERVRRRLLEGAPGETVTSVAQDWGFSHLGRFAVFYRQCFGERPSETLRRARASRPVQAPPATALH